MNSNFFKLIFSFFFNKTQILIFLYIHCRNKSYQKIFFIRPPCFSVIFIISSMNQSYISNIYFFKHLFHEVFRIWNLFLLSFHQFSNSRKTSIFFFFCNFIIFQTWNFFFHKTFRLTISKVHSETISLKFVFL